MLRGKIDRLLDDRFGGVGVKQGLKILGELQRFLGVALQRFEGLSELSLVALLKRTFKHVSVHALGISFEGRGTGRSGSVRSCPVGSVAVASAAT